MGLLSRFFAAKLSTPAISNPGIDGYVDGTGGGPSLVTDLTPNRTIGASLLRNEHRAPWQPYRGQPNIAPLTYEGSAGRTWPNILQLMEFAPLGAGTRTFKTWEVLNPISNNIDLVKMAQGLGQLANELSAYYGPATMLGNSGTGFTQDSMVLPQQPSTAATPTSPNPDLEAILQGLQ